MDTDKTLISNSSIDNRIPGYTLLKELGQGGMATVYLAIQECFGRKVALKIMAPVLATDPSFSERFQREAKIVAGLSHNHIISVYDVGVSDNAHYIAMEYHAGGDLKQKIRKGLTLRSAITIVSQIASALDCAHSKGYIHRDVKPDNILFREDGDAILTDFGIARPTKASQSMTQAGKVVGTPKYMSPEQAKGHELDARADLYALGVVFFEMLSGAPPYDGEDAIAIGIKHLKEPVPALPEAYSALQDIINRMLAKDPDKRFQRGKDIIAALQAAQVNYTDKVLNSRIRDMISPATENRIKAHAETIRADLEDRVATTQESGGSWLAASVSALAVAGSLFAAAVWLAPAYLPQAKPLVSLNQQLFGGGQKDAAQSPAIAQVKQSASSGAAKGIVAETQLSATQQDAIVTLAAKSPGQSGAVESSVSGGSPVQADASPAVSGETPAAASTSDPEVSAQELLAQRQQAEARALQERISSLLTEADSALKANRLSKPEGDSAIDKYREVLTLAADNAEAKAGLRNVAVAYQRLAERALADQAFDRAHAMISRAKELSPDNPDVTQLAQQISSAEKQHQAKLEEQRRVAAAAAAEEKRRQEAAARQARELAEQQRREAEETAMLNKVRITGLLRGAQNDMDRGQLISPADNNALQKYRQVLALDKNNQQAIQGVDAIGDQVVSDIRTALAANQVDDAKALMIDAIKLLPEHRELPALREAIDGHLAIGP